MKPGPRRFARKSERGTTVMVVVLATTLITAIGVFAVRNAGQVDLAVGYSRQAAQTLAIAELGTTAALAQIAVKGAPYYLDKMDTIDPNLRCAANPSPTALATMDAVTTCWPLSQGEMEDMTSDTFFEAPVPASGESGSFGPFSKMQGAVMVELTEKHQTNDPVKGEQDGTSTYFDVTMTTTGKVRPEAIGGDECAIGIPTSTVKKVMRAHTVLGPYK